MVWRFKHSRWTDSQHELRAWYASSLGQSMLTEVRNALRRVLGRVYGYHALQIGVVEEPPYLVQHAGLFHRLVLDSGYSNARIDVHAEPARLPFMTSRVDLAVLVHGLDFSEDPYELLREVDRVVSPDGHLLVIGFSPYSWLGLGHGLLKWKRQIPWSGRFLPAHRVREWLTVLGYRSLSLKSVFFRPPLHSVQWLRRLRYLESWGDCLPFGGSVYVLLARKQTIPVTPQRARAWRRRRALVAAGTIGSSISSVPHDSSR